MECDLAMGIWIWVPMENKSMQGIFHQCPAKSANAEKEKAKKDCADWSLKIIEIIHFKNKNMNQNPMQAIGCQRE